MLTLLGTIFGSIFSGGATGILGVIAQRFADYKNRQLDLEKLKLEHEQNVALRKLDAEIAAQEWAARTQVAQVEAAGKEAVADAQAFEASFKMEPARYAEGVKPSRGQGWMLVLLDCLRGSIRPLLTVYLCVVTTLVYLQAYGLMESKALGAAEALELVKLVIGTILYLTTTCVLWWFGTRNRGAPPSAAK